MTNKQLYKNITPKEKRSEIRLLKEEIKELEKQTKTLKKALDYLKNYEKR